MDNILIYIAKAENYYKYIIEILYYFCKYKLFINLKKYAIYIEEIEFLKFLISINKGYISFCYIKIIAN